MKLSLEESSKSCPLGTKAQTSSQRGWDGHRTRGLAGPGLKGPTGGMNTLASRERVWGVEPPLAAAVFHRLLVLIGSTAHAE